MTAGTKSLFDCRYLNVPARWIWKFVPRRQVCSACGQEDHSRV